MAPMPVRVTVCGLPWALSVMEMEPVAGPAVVGLKVTLIVQLALGFSVGPQVLVWVNGPVATMLVRFRLSTPLLLRVTDLELLVVETTWTGKVRLAGDTVAAGNRPKMVNC